MGNEKRLRRTATPSTYLKKNLCPPQHEAKSQVPKVPKHLIVVLTRSVDTRSGCRDARSPSEAAIAVSRASPDPLLLTSAGLARMVPSHPLVDVFSRHGMHKGSLLDASRCCMCRHARLRLHFLFSRYLCSGAREIRLLNRIIT